MNEDRQHAVDEALARAVVYRALSLGLQMPTDGRICQAGARERFAPVAVALERIDRESRGGALTSAAAKLSSFSMPPIEMLVATFVRLFGHTTRGLVCSCETEYGADNTFHQPQQLADISGYYLAFGLKSATAVDVRSDHVACECEFMDFLNRKEALFLSTRGDDDETIEVTRAAARTFLRDHLGRFGRAFATCLMSEDPGGFFGVLGGALFALLDEECRRLGINTGPIDLEVRPEVPDDTPMACGTSEACGAVSEACGTPSELIQIQRRP